MPLHEWNEECQQEACRHAFGKHAQIGKWCAECAAECVFLPLVPVRLPMFDWNLASTPRLRNGRFRFPFKCGCRAEWDPLLDRLDELRFCHKDDCPSSQYAQEVFDEYLTEQKAPEEELVTKPGTTVGVLGMLAGLIKRGG